MIIYVFWPRKVEQVAIGNCTFKAEVSNSLREQYRGLSRRRNLEQDRGMLFLFNKPQDLVFVMREMNFPLDIIFIKEGKVVNLYRDLPPESKKPEHTYHSGGEADAVLEITGGRSQACGIAAGSSISW
ncbi:MAG: DUF192 domain-containing protein [Bacillota bacterium]